MGAHNVAAVYTHWWQLKDKPIRMLAYMALVTMDADTPPRYWGGHDALALALGRRIPPEPEPWDQGARATATRRRRRADLEAVRSAMRELIEAGAVTVLSPAAPGRRAEYGLRLAISTPQEIPVERPRDFLSMSQENPADATGNSWPQGRGGGRGEQRGTTSPEGGTSPEEEYREAMMFLQRLPDLGQSLLAGVPDGPARERIITAYRLAREAS